MTISLEKGQRISLEKNGKTLSKVCLGVNWGMIEKSGFFSKKKVAVDLDASVALYTKDKQVFDVIYFGQLKSKDGSICHSGDDLTGDSDGDDGLDNEIITVDLEKVPQDVMYISFLLNSFKGQNFGSIPFTSIRIYEGTPKKVDYVLAKYNIASDPKFSHSVSMILGNIYRHNQAFKFRAIGEASESKKLKELVDVVQQGYL